MKPRNGTAVLSDARMDCAVIDIGSNTIRLVVYGGAKRAPRAIINEKLTARLGRDLASTGRIPGKAIEIALAGLARYAVLLADLKITDIEVVATAASRDAENGAEFLDKVRALGFQPRLLKGEEEAEASAMGVIGAFPDARGTVADLGGGSLELIAIDTGRWEHGVSLPLGTLLLPHVREGGGDRLRKIVIKALTSSDWDTPHHSPLYLVGGTWRALAKFARQQIDWPLNDTHAFELDPARTAKMLRALARTEPAILDDIRGLSSMRADALPDAGALLQILMEELEPEKLVFSSWGLREGLLYQRLDPAARTQDPLVAGMAAFATPRGCTPQRAAKIAGWTVGAVSSAVPGRERWRLAATMLAMASQSIEKNLRGQQGIEWALHKRWLGLSAPGRAMIAAAILANCGETELPSELGLLADAELLEEGIRLGLAIRLFRRLDGGSDKLLEASALTARDGRLLFSLGESRAALRGYQLDKDLANLAGRLGLEPVLEVVPDEQIRRH